MRGFRRSSEQKKWPLVIVFVVLIGSVSLLTDLANESSRVMLGPYLTAMGASAAMVTLVAGLSELFGYSLRALFGRITDRTGRYWTLTFIGYSINLVAVPALALVDNWTMAIGLILVERIGRAVRGPAREAMISHASSKSGRGWAYGVQEALSSIGGMLGPVVVVLVLLLGGNYHLSYALMLLPLLLMMVILVYAWRLNPRPRDMEGKCTRSDVRRELSHTYWLFVAAAALMAAGYIDFPLISVCLDGNGWMDGDLLPLLYALAMAADALSALLFGKLYDRRGMGVLIIAAAITPIFVPLVFSGEMLLMLLGMILYGVGFGAQESIMKSMVADMAPHCIRGTAFGYYNAVFGIAWFTGSICIGLLFEISLISTIIVAMGLQLASIPVLLRVRREFRFRPRWDFGFDD